MCYSWDMEGLQKILAKDIAIGMQFSEPLFFDDGKNMFLASRKPVKQYHLDAIANWSIQFFITKGHQLSEAEIADANDDIEEIETLD